MTPLPMIDRCGGCGLCCTHLGTPPGFYPAFLSPHWDGTFLTDSEDYRYFLAMPEAVREELRAYYADLDRGAVPDRAALKLPCLWFDSEAKRCRHYDHRPEVCREFEPGEEDCLRFRKRGGL